MAEPLVLKINGVQHSIDLDPATYTAGEINAIERHTGMTWQEWILKLADRRVSSLAWTALAWVAARRAGSFLPFDEFEDSIKIMELIESAAPEAVTPPPAATAATLRKKTARA